MTESHDQTEPGSRASPALPESNEVLVKARARTGSVGRGSGDPQARKASPAC